jgi:hypothetical protein
MTLLLTEPYGYGRFGHHISLTSEGVTDRDELAQVLRGYSCYEPAIPKIFNSLTYSNRYDCVVQSGWFKAQIENLRRDLREIGVALTVID